MGNVWNRKGAREMLLHALYAAGAGYDNSAAIVAWLTEISPSRLSHVLAIFWVAGARRYMHLQCIMILREERERGCLAFALVNHRLYNSHPSLSHTEISSESRWEIHLDTTLHREIINERGKRRVARARNRIVYMRWWWDALSIYFLSASFSLLSHIVFDMTYIKKNFWNNFFAVHHCFSLLFASAIWGFSTKQNKKCTFYREYRARFLFFLCQKVPTVCNWGGGGAFYAYNKRECNLAIVADLGHVKSFLSKWEREKFQWELPHQLWI